MALTKVTGQVIKNTTDVTVGVLTVTNTLAVGGTVSIGGTLTYEDVTNVDAVGLITARNGIVVGSGITLSKDGDVFATGVTTTGSLVSSGAISGTTGTFSGAVSGTTGAFTGVVTLADGVGNGLKIGNGQDLILQHNGTQTFIDNNTGNLTLQTTGSGEDINIESLDDVFIKVHGSENAIRCIGDGAVELYYDNSKKIETISTGVVITGSDDGDGGAKGDFKFFQTDGTLKIMFDASTSQFEFLDNSKASFGNDDDLKIYHDGNSRIQNTNNSCDFRIQSDSVEIKANSVDEYMIKGTVNGAVELYHNNVKKIETATEGVVIPSGGGNCLRVFGQNIHHATSALVIGQNSTTVSQLRAYGPDTSTNGQINFRASRSDGSSSVNLTYNGNLQFDSGYGIDFSATANTDQTGSSMSSELFDDYEEGSWTPGNSDMGITNHYAYYTKVGRMVHIVMDITFASSPSDTSQVGYVTQLPFDAGNFAQHVTVQWFGTSSVNDNNFYNTWMQTYVASGDDKLSILDARYGSYVPRSTLAGKKLRANFWYVAT